MSGTHGSAASMGQQLEPGQSIGRYRLLSLVASGGMAQIWAAKPESGGFSRTVALKVVRPEYAGDDEYRKMLIDEAAAAAAVHHPNVCEIFELGEDGHVVFIAMEWVPGDSIAGLIRQETQYVPFSYALAARVIADACAGLHAAHLACRSDGQPMNIVHRDISPQNILLSSQGHVKVTDFGIAKARDQLHSKTRTGEIKGKFAYIAAEQILGQAVDLRSDIYAMGCVLYVATLGLRPFGRGNHAVMSKIVQGDYTAPRDIVASYPEGLEKIVVQALARQPDERFQSAEEMRLALESWLNQSGKIVTHSDIARAVTERLTPKVREQIQALRSANRFTPRNIAARVTDTASPSSWEVPTAVGPHSLPRAKPPSPMAGRIPQVVAPPGPLDHLATQRSVVPDLRDNCSEPAVEDIRDRATVAPGTRRRQAQSLQQEAHALPPLEPSDTATATATRPRQTPVPPSATVRSSEAADIQAAPPPPAARDTKRTVALTMVVALLIVLAYIAGGL